MVEVVDDGRGASVPPGAGGFGLVGMRERVGMFAGQLVAGPRPGGGWRVRATLPDRPDRRGDVTIRVVLVDDQAMVRAGFRMILECERRHRRRRRGGRRARGGRPGRPGAARRGADGRAHAARRRHRGDPPRSRATADPPHVLILTTFDLDDYVYAALRAGASGFLLKDAPAEQLVDAVRVIAAGDALLAPSVTRRLIEDVARRPALDATAPPGLADAHRSRARGAAARSPAACRTPRSPSGCTSARRR